MYICFFFFQAEDGIRDYKVTGVQTCALPIYAATPDDGKTSNIFREKTSAWVEVVDEGLRWLKDGSFLWLSDRSGWRHIYHYGADGHLINQVTSGDWDVRSLDSVDEAKGTVYFSGTEHSFIANHEY